MKRILITNDDGIHAPGLKALEKGLMPLGEVTVVAPDREMSATSQSISLHTPLRIHAIDERHYAVAGTPADTVIIALHHLLKEKPDLVVSGINPGGKQAEGFLRRRRLRRATGRQGFGKGIAARHHAQRQCAARRGARRAHHPPEPEDFAERCHRTGRPARPPLL
ncbi:MAG: hypothetical protein HYS61_04640, partial [Acidobacteria bacterium]|nr:hypothetical protein [Acidobacteriota bacterium]